MSLVNHMQSFLKDHFTTTFSAQLHNMIKSSFRLLALVDDIDAVVLVQSDDKAVGTTYRDDATESLHSLAAFEVEPASQVQRQRILENKQPASLWTDGHAMDTGRSNATDSSATPTDTTSKGLVSSDYLTLQADADVGVTELDKWAVSGVGAVLAGGVHWEHCLSDARSVQSSCIEAQEPTDHRFAGSNSASHTHSAGSNSASHPHTRVAGSNSASHPDTHVAGSNSASHPHTRVAGSNSASHPDTHVFVSTDRKRKRSAPNKVAAKKRKAKEDSTVLPPEMVAGELDELSCNRHFTASTKDIGHLNRNIEEGMTSQTINGFNSSASSSVNDDARTPKVSSVNDDARTPKASSVNDDTRTPKASSVNDDARTPKASSVTDVRAPKASSVNGDASAPKASSVTDDGKAPKASSVTDARAPKASSVKDDARAPKTSSRNDARAPKASLVNDDARAPKASSVKDDARAPKASSVKDDASKLQASSVKDDVMVLQASSMNNEARAPKTNSVKDTRAPKVSSVIDGARAPKTSSVNDDARTPMASSVKDDATSLQASSVNDDVRALQVSSVNDDARALQASSVNDDIRALQASTVKDNARALQASSVNDDARESKASTVNGVAGALQESCVFPVSLTNFESEPQASSVNDGNALQVSSVNDTSSLQASPVNNGCELQVSSVNDGSALQASHVNDDDSALQESSFNDINNSNQTSPVKDDDSVNKQSLMAGDDSVNKPVHCRDNVKTTSSTKFHGINLVSLLHDDDSVNKAGAADYGDVERNVHLQPVSRSASSHHGTMPSSPGRSSYPADTNCPFALHMVSASKSNTRVANSRGGIPRAENLLMVSAKSHYRAHMSSLRMAACESREGDLSARRWVSHYTTVAESRRRRGWACLAEARKLLKHASAANHRHRQRSYGAQEGNKGESYTDTAAQDAKDRGRGTVDKGRGMEGDGLSHNRPHISALDPFSIEDGLAAFAAKVSSRTSQPVEQNRINTPASRMSNRSASQSVSWDFDYPCFKMIEFDGIRSRNTTLATCTLDSLHHTRTESLYHPSADNLQHPSAENLHDTSADSLHHAIADNLHHPSADNLHRHKSDSLHRSSIDNLHHTSADSLHHASANHHNADNLHRPTCKSDNLHHAMAGNPDPRAYRLALITDVFPTIPGRSCKFIPAAPVSARQKPLNIPLEVCTSAAPRDPRRWAARSHPHATDARLQQLAGRGHSSQPLEQCTIGSLEKQRAAELLNQSVSKARNRGKPTSLYPMTKSSDIVASSRDPVMGDRDPVMSDKDPIMTIKGHAESRKEHVASGVLVEFTEEPSASIRLPDRDTGVMDCTPAATNCPTGGMEQVHSEVSVSDVTLTSNDVPDELWNCASASQQCHDVADVLDTSSMDSFTYDDIPSTVAI